MPDCIGRDLFWRRAEEAYQALQILTSVVQTGTIGPDAWFSKMKGLPHLHMRRRRLGVRPLV